MLMTKEEIAEEHVQEVEDQIDGLEALIDDLVRYCNKKEKEAFDRSGRNIDPVVLAYCDLKGYLQERTCYYLGR